jgi:hypothetical protein
LILLAFLAGLAVNPISAQEKEKKAATSATDKAGKSTKGDDAHIKSKSNANDPAKAVGDPIKKGGKTRGWGPYTCVVHVDNRTSWSLNVYVDGYFRGAVGGGGDLYIATGNGATGIYASADFTDGSYIPFGPRAFDCGTSYTWTLWP